MGRGGNPKVPRRTGYLLHDEPGSLCLLLRHLLHLHRLRELLAEGQVGLGGTNQSGSQQVTDPSSSGTLGWGRKPGSPKETGTGGDPTPIPIPECSARCHLLDGTRKAPETKCPGCLWAETKSPSCTGFLLLPVLPEENPREGGTGVQASFQHLIHKGINLIYKGRWEGRAPSLGISAGSRRTPL